MQLTLAVEGELDLGDAAVGVEDLFEDIDRDVFGEALDDDGAATARAGAERAGPEEGIRGGPELVRSVSQSLDWGERVFTSTSMGWAIC